MVRMTLMAVMALRVVIGDGDRDSGNHSHDGNDSRVGVDGGHDGNGSPGNVDDG